MKRFVQISMWVLSTILVVSLICTCLNEPNTLMAIVGFILAIAWITVSIKTKCFTYMPFNRIQK